MCAAATFLCDTRGSLSHSEPAFSLEGGGSHGDAPASLHIFPLPWVCILQAAAGQTTAVLPGSVTLFHQTIQGCSHPLSLLVCRRCCHAICAVRRPMQLSVQYTQRSP